MKIKRKTRDELLTQKGKYEKIINQQEDELDYMNNEITKFLIDPSPNLDPDYEKYIGSYFHVINDIERIGDHIVNIGYSVKNPTGDEVVVNIEQ